MYLREKAKVSKRKREKESKREKKPKNVLKRESERK